MKPSTKPNPAEARRRHHAASAFGFTLIELMVTVAIVAILAAIAYPSYRSYVLRSNRSDALSELTKTQVILERCYAQTYSYASCAGIPSYTSAWTTARGIYSIQTSSSDSYATTYVLTATPQGPQANDSTCPSITIDQSNQKAPAACWNP